MHRCTRNGPSTSGDFPDGLSVTDIPLAARIVAVADVFDALTSSRVYNNAFDPAVSRNMIEEEAGKHFDPVIVDAFLRRFDDILAAAKLNVSADKELMPA